MTINIDSNKQMLYDALYLAEQRVKDLTKQTNIALIGEEGNIAKTIEKIFEFCDNDAEVVWCMFQLGSMVEYNEMVARLSEGPTKGQA